MVVELGKCPFCNSITYVRNDTTFEDDFARVECFCNDCDKWFTEYFALDEVKFDDDDGGEFIYNKNLCKNEKEMIREWAEEQLEGNIDEEYKGKIIRIVEVMSGGLNRE